MKFLSIYLSIYQNDLRLSSQLLECEHFTLTALKEYVEFRCRLTEQVS